MKAKVRLSHSVELFIEADNEEQLTDWLSVHTPNEARDIAHENGRMIFEDFSEEILCAVQEISDVDICIKEDCSISSTEGKKTIFVHNMNDTCSLYRCECGENIYVHHDCGLANGNDAPNYCNNCGCKFLWEF